MAAQGTGELRDRRALVTDSTQGAGAAIAQRLRREGADVWTTAHARRPPRPATAIVPSASGSA
jgi:NAD(P)-dependent dehydrogenase (short-subunit alcohol dehydrogenase family)